MAINRVSSRPLRPRRDHRGECDWTTSHVRRGPAQPNAPCQSVKHNIFYFFLLTWPQRHRPRPRRCRGRHCHGRHGPTPLLRSPHFLAAIPTDARRPGRGRDGSAGDGGAAPQAMLRSPWPGRGRL